MWKEVHFLHVQPLGFGLKCCCSLLADVQGQVGSIAPMQTDSECGYSTNFSPDHSTPGFLYLFPLNTRLLWVSFPPVSAALAMVFFTVVSSTPLYLKRSAFPLLGTVDKFLLSNLVMDSLFLFLFL